MKELTVFYSDIRQILQNARSRAYSEINRAMVEAYWLICKRIVEEEQEGKTKAEYGKKLLENLSRNLTHEFGKGFSYATLRNFRQFYLTYPDEKIRYTLCSKLSWSHEFKRGEDDNPTVGLILCTSKDDTIVRFSVLKDSKQLFASQFRLVLPSEEELVAEIEREKRLIEMSEEDQ